MINNIKYNKSNIISMEVFKDILINLIIKQYNKFKL